MFELIVANNEDLESTYGEDWRCDNFVPALKSVVCPDNPCADICADPEILSYAKFFRNLDALGIYSLNGPNRTQQATDYCDAYPEDTANCQLLTNLEVYQPDFFTLPSEQSTRVFQEFIQRAFSGKNEAYSPTWSHDAWCTESTELDLSTISVPVSAQQVSQEVTSKFECDIAATAALLGTQVSTLNNIHVWSDGLLTNDGSATDLPGFNSDDVFNTIKL